MNGGLFLRHPIEEAHGRDIQIADAAFEKRFTFFEQYQWHSDERPLRRDNEINPDVLGYIFEKYINQKQMGAYYTKEDITGYISQNTVVPFLFDAARQKCKIAFEGEQSAWRLLQSDPDRYIYDAVRRGVTDANGHVIPESALPEFVQKDMHDPKARMFDKRYNLGQASIPGPQGEHLALPTETWREYIQRRGRCLELRAKLAAGEVQSINDLITYNLDIRQFAQGVVENSEGPELLPAFYHAIERVTVLDPACGSGAFLFAALNILEPLYDACLDRMQMFVDDLERSGEKHRPEKFSDFKKILARVAQHPNRRSFILKSIIVNNLFGVDIMEEAAEICKLRLFLKLVAQVESSDKIEPLPDIDFNIRAGNSLVGYATYDDVKRAVSSKLDFEGAMGKIEEKAQEVERLFALFRQQQTEIGGEVTPGDKSELRKRLKVLEDELNEYLAGEYGVQRGDKAAYRKWVESHKPFHWFIEFYGIMKEGGFDVAIGNPPYVGLSVVTDYDLRDYACADCGNLYAVMMERAGALGQACGREGFIVPVSSVSTDRYVALQHLLVRRAVHYGSYDDRPSRLFEGLEHSRLTIHLMGGQVETPVLHSTRYKKWISLERDALFDGLAYTPSRSMIVAKTLPKLSSTVELRISDKMTSQQASVALFYRNLSGNGIFYSGKVGYFLRVLDFEPEVRDASKKRRRLSEFKRLDFSSVHHSKAALCCLNSNLFYWFVTVFSDCRHVNTREVDAFPIDLDALVKSEAGPSLTRLADLLMTDLKKNSQVKVMRFSHDTLTVQCISPKASEPVIDQIDALLAGHYGFTDEELDFIINYDIKYRMGREAAEDAED